MTMTESNITLSDQSNRILISHQPIAADRTGLFIGLFLLFLLFVLIAYLLYSFLSYKRFSWQHHRQETNFILDSNLNKTIEQLVDDDDDGDEDLINKNEKVLPRTNSFSDCGTSMRSSSTRSHPYPYNHRRSSSYKLYSQTSNLLTPRVSSQIMTADECLEAKMIIEPGDIQSANALSRSISKYYERKRKPILCRRAHSCEQLMFENNSQIRRPLKVTSSLPVHRGGLRRIPERKTRHSDIRRVLQSNVSNQTSLRRKPTTIYELYRTDRMRIANLLLTDP